ncbi:uncharacterized protein KY384_006633 [Bacidia gigantensis]|uniref:uncharacterized protein n=1 Tax=Bacidia gigantensis TaxID=2732470 RepID=UPI001D039703|nr:uncharacterized protein KY384_006633 [Bacidia gigantensis]KAG8528944.1 hypothetical protein KY384_006633 [Bacidia gigantensis]
MVPFRRLDFQDNPIAEALDMCARLRFVLLEVNVKPNLVYDDYDIMGDLIVGAVKGLKKPKRSVVRVDARSWETTRHVAEEVAHELEYERDVETA